MELNAHPQCNTFRLTQGPGEQPALVCSECGKPSRSAKWRANVFGLKQAEEMSETERRMAAMTEQQKSKLLDGLLTADGAIRHDAQLTEEQRIIVAERRIPKAKSPTDIRLIREQAPGELREAVTEAQRALEEAEAVHHRAQDAHWQALKSLNKIRRGMNGSRDRVPKELKARFDRAEQKVRQAQEVEKQAETACGPGSDLRMWHARAVTALDAWAYDEQARRRREIDQQNKKKGYANDESRTA